MATDDNATRRPRVDQAFSRAVFEWLPVSKRSRSLNSILRCSIKNVSNVFVCSSRIISRDETGIWKVCQESVTFRTLWKQLKLWHVRSFPLPTKLQETVTLAARLAV